MTNDPLNELNQSAEKFMGEPVQSPQMTAPTIDEELRELRMTQRWSKNNGR